MVRLETLARAKSLPEVMPFTFQYGQIRNDEIKKKKEETSIIYIPVWLDQKPVQTTAPQIDLSFTFQYGQIRNTSKYF